MQPPPRSGRPSRPSPAARCSRVRLWAAQVEIALAAGDLATASGGQRRARRGGVDVRRSGPGGRGPPGPWRGAARAGDAAAALPMLRVACGLWSELAAPYDVARTRLLLARAYRGLGDDDAAALELDAAEETFVRLGAALDAEQVRRLRRRPSPARRAHAAARRRCWPWSPPAAATGRSPPRWCSARRPSRGTCRTSSPSSGCRPEPQRRRTPSSAAWRRPRWVNAHPCPHELHGSPDVAAAAGSLASGQRLATKGWIAMSADVIDSWTSNGSRSSPGGCSTSTRPGCSPTWSTSGTAPVCSRPPPSGPATSDELAGSRRPAGALRPRVGGRAGDGRRPRLRRRHAVATGLPAEHAACLTGTGAANLAPVSRLCTLLAPHVPAVGAAFRDGGGVPVRRVPPGVHRRDGRAGRGTYDELLLDGFLPLAGELPSG